MIYLVESKQTDTSTNILEFHRDGDKTDVKTVTTFKPYFFVDEKCPIDKFEGVIGIEKGYTSIDETPVKKVTVQKSSLVKPLRIKVEGMGFKHWEADILFHNRYTADLNEDIPETKLKVCWIDIETDMIDVAPNLEIADQAICCLTTKIEDEKVTWLCGSESYPNVRYFPNEIDMLNDFMSYFYDKSPDIISAWNLGNFDLPYLLRRCKRLGVDYRRLSKVKDVWDKTFRGKKYYRTIGTVQFDLLDAYRLWRKYGNLPLLDSYSLDYVAKTVLGDTKLYHGKTIGWLWRNDLKTLIEYNRHDVELLDRIDKRCKVIGFFDEIRRKCRIQFEDVYKTTAMLDGFLLSRLKGKTILPTAKYNKEEDKFTGAIVFEPKPGLYNNVLCEDIASMYPSIIKNFDISYETVGGGEIILPLNPAISFKKTGGIIPMFLDELKEERDEYKRLRKQYAKNTAEWELYDQRQFATKIIMNSMFGYLGFVGSRLYKRPVAAAITGMGQYLLQKIAEWVKEKNNEVVYGDTDSVYITSTKEDRYEVVMEGVEIMNYVNEKLKDLCTKIAGTNELYIEFEKVCERALFVESKSGKGAKKRYAYTVLWDSDKKFDVDKQINIQGFDSKRSDSNEVSKYSQKAVIKMLIENKDRREIIEFLRDLDKRMRRGEFTDEQIGFPKGIQKELEAYDTPGPIIKGAKYSNDNFGTTFGKGSKPKFIYIKGYKGKEKTVHLNSKSYILESIAFDKSMPEGFEVNWNKMCNNTFRMKIENIFKAVGWEWEDLSFRGLDSFKKGGE